MLGHEKKIGKTYLASGYHQVEMNLDHCHKTAFQTRLSFFEYVVIPLGLSNAPNILQKLMYSVF